MSDNSENLDGDPFSENSELSDNSDTGAATKYYWNQKSKQNITEIKIQKLKFATKSKFEKTKKLSYNKIKRKGFQKLKI